MVEDIKQELINRIVEPFAKTIDCEDGWLPLLADLHEHLSDIDPNYTIYQVKEKFGGLRFYYSLSNPEVADDAQKVVNFFETISLTICEKTGLPGQLMTRNGWYKTLNDTYTNEGWKPA